MVPVYTRAAILANRETASTIAGWSSARTQRCAKVNRRNRELSGALASLGVAAREKDYDVSRSERPDRASRAVACWSTSLADRNERYIESIRQKYWSIYAGLPMNLTSVHPGLHLGVCTAAATVRIGGFAEAKGRRFAPTCVGRGLSRQRGRSKH